MHVTVCVATISVSNMNILLSRDLVAQCNGQGVCLQNRSLQVQALTEIFFTFKLMLQFVCTKSAIFSFYLSGSYLCRNNIYTSDTASKNKYVLYIVFVVK